MWSDVVEVIVAPLKEEGSRSNPADIFFVSSLDFSEISKGSRVKCFRKFLKGKGLNRLRKFTGQGTCSRIHSEVFLGNMRCFWFHDRHSNQQGTDHTKQQQIRSHIVAFGRLFFCETQKAISYF
jgi:hypothetical protein